MGRTQRRFTLRHVTRHVEQLDLIDRFEMRVVREFPDDLFVRRQLKAMGLFADMTMPKVIAENRISVWQTLQTSHKSERIAGDLLLVHFPDDLLMVVELDEPVAIATGNEEVPVGEQNRFVDIAGHRDGAEQSAFAVQLVHAMLAFATNQIMPVTGLADSAILIVPIHTGRRRHKFHLLFDFPVPS